MADDRLANLSLLLEEMGLQIHTESIGDVDPMVKCMTETQNYFSRLDFDNENGWIAYAERYFAREIVLDESGDLVLKIVSRKPDIDNPPLFIYELDNDISGQFLWKASQILAAFIMETRDIIVNKRVLELGCGAGLCGIVSALFADVVALTDSNPTCLKLANHNVEINYGDFSTDTPLKRLAIQDCRIIRSKVIVEKLRWGDFDIDFDYLFNKWIEEKRQISTKSTKDNQTENCIMDEIEPKKSLLRHKFDIVVGADLLIFPWHVSMLMKTLCAYTTDDSGFLYCHQLRNDPPALIIEKRSAEQEEKKIAQEKFLSINDNKSNDKTQNQMENSETISQAVSSIDCSGIESDSALLIARSFGDSTLVQFLQLAFSTGWTWVLLQNVVIPMDDFSEEDDGVSETEAFLILLFTRRLDDEISSNDGCN